MLTLSIILAVSTVATWVIILTSRDE